MGGGWPAPAQWCELPGAVVTDGPRLGGLDLAPSLWRLQRGPPCHFWLPVVPGVPWLVSPCSSPRILPHTASFLVDAGLLFLQGHQSLDAGSTLIHSGLGCLTNRICKDYLYTKWCSGFWGDMSVWGHFNPRDGCLLPMCPGTAEVLAWGCGESGVGEGGVPGSC